jgi:glycosyltransferase domain-containing protein
MKLTILVPTRNRPQFLARLLEYYSRVNILVDIYVGDASDEMAVASVNRDLCMNYQARYFRIKKTVGATIKDLLEYVKTEFVTILPDDDILLPKAMNEIVTFLENNPEYHSANGRVVQVDLEGATGKIWDLGEYPINGIYGNSSRSRLYEWRRVILFSIYHTSVYKRLWSYSDVGLYDQAIHDEIIPNCISAVTGKTAQLENVYLIRQGHSNRFIGKGWNDWIKSPEFHDARKVYINAVSGYVTDGTLNRKQVEHFFDTRYPQKPREEKKKKRDYPKWAKRLKILYLDIFRRDLTLDNMTKYDVDFRIFRELVEGRRCFCSCFPKTWESK